MIERDRARCAAIHIESIMTVFYREFTASFSYAGERHDFWELVVVDQGEIYVTADKEQFLLKQGDIIFHQPNEFHALRATSRAASNVIIISFVCHSPAMASFERTVLHLTKGQLQLLAKIVREAYGYAPNLSGVRVGAPEEMPPFGAQQLPYLYLEQFLIEMVRSKRILINDARMATETVTNFPGISDSQIIEEIIAYMKAHLDENLRYEDIINQFYIGSTYLKVFFRRQTGMSVMQYYRMLKMNQAKKYIREETMTYSQIALALGFDNVQYFSTSFKRCFHMSPSEYKRSIQMMEYEAKLQEEAE